MAQKTFNKKANREEISMYEILNTLADTYNPLFSLLELPKTISIDTENSEIELPYYEGETFNEKWTEFNCGSSFGLELSDEVPILIKDFSLINTKLITENSVAKDISNLIYNHESYKKEFSVLMDDFVQNDLINQEDKEKAEQLIDKDFTTSLIFNNADFYPRNFIKTADRIVIIDWDTWSEDSRANIIDHPENVAAFCFVHMWKNEPWLKNYIQGLQKQLHIQEDEFKKAVLMKAAGMVKFWREVTKEKPEYEELYGEQLHLFKNILNDGFIERLWK